MASHEDRTEEEKTEEIKMLIREINFNSINDSIMAINQIRNWGINKYNDPIKVIEPLSYRWLLGSPHSGRSHYGRSVSLVGSTFIFIQTNESERPE